MADFHILVRIVYKVSPAQYFIEELHVYCQKEVAWKYMS